MVSVLALVAFALGARLCRGLHPPSAAPPPKWRPPTPAPKKVPTPVSGPGVNPARNVLGGDLECCCGDVRGTGVGTGFFRDGHCSTGPMDEGRHTVCILATADFLAFSKKVGNDLSSPVPAYAFPGLQPGDKWCLCASRWAQARTAGAAPQVFLRATHEKTLDHTTLEALKAHAVDLQDAQRDIDALDNLRRMAMKTAGFI